MPWDPKAKTGESGFADDYILAISAARYGTPFPTAADVVALVLDGEREIDGELDDGHLWLSVGDFEPGDKEGSFALHSSQDADKHFNQNSKVMKFIKSAIDAGVPIEERQDPKRAEYQEKDALMWVGLRLRIHEESIPEKSDPKTGQVFQASRQPLVTEYLGTVDAPKASQEAPADAVASAASNGGGSTESLVARAKELARKSPDYMKYLEDVTSGEYNANPADAVAQKDFFEAAKTAKA